MPLSKTRFRKGVIIAADADALEGIEGEIKIDSADNKIKTTLNATPHEVITNDQSQILSNKTLTSPVINTGVSGTAIDTDVTLAANSDTLLASQKAIKAYVTAVAGAQDAASEITVTPAGTISSTNVQAALQELDTDIQNHLSDATDAHDASAISNVPAGSIAATDVQAAINELDTDIQNHITDSADAHDASAISNVPSGNLAATDVQAALNELQGDIDTNTSGISNHLSDATDAHDASAISVLPTGNLAASDVQSALNELQGDADASNTHIAASTNVHGVGVGNSVVGTGTSQVLTNKTITGADIRTPVRSDVKQDTKANLTTYALTASNGQLCFATDTKEMFQVVDTLLESVGGGAGIGGVDILFSQTFEEAALTDFTQTGMSLSTSSPIHGAISALMTHQAGTPQSFKQVIAVDEKFRGQAMLLELNIKSTATAGNVTLTVRDETNSANIVASEQLTLSSDTGGIKVFSAFTIPVTCLSMSYTITALPESGSPVTRIDDILCQLNNASLLETSVTVPNITAWQGYTPTFQGFGTPSAVEFEWRQVGENVEIRGKFLAGTATGVEARIGLPAGLTSAGTGLIPSIQKVGTGAIDYSATTYFNTAILIEPSVTYVTIGQQLSNVSEFTKRTGTLATPGLGLAFSLFASVPILGLTATSDVAIPLTQSGIVQEADSYIKLYAPNGYGSTNTAIPRFATLQTSIGSGILYQDSATLGNSFTAVEDGIYTFTGYSASIVSTTAHRVGLSINLAAPITTSISSVVATSLLAFAGDSVNTATTSAKIVPFTWSGKLNAGDIVRVHTDTNALSDLYVSVAQQGSLKQVNINTNSKITIPTSELRFEGASARGAVATAIVKFDTMAKIRGDAFTVTNTANDGTFVTMTKAGRLSVSASVYMNSSSEMTISKNQSVLTTIPTISGQAIAYSYVSTSAASINLSGTTDVAIGDIIRVSVTAATVLNANSILNHFNLSFQEQDIQVSVSNTLPQFSESDSSVRLDTANGYGSTNTKIRRFSSVRTNLGSDIQYVDSATLGSSFTVATSGIYNVTYSETSNANTTTMDVNLLLNSIDSTEGNQTTLAFDNQIYNTASSVTKYASCSWQGYLAAGNIVRPYVSAAVNNNGQNAFFTMSKVGKPNVTGVDVTPFVNVPQPVSQSMYLTGTSVVTDTIIKPTVVSDTSNGIVAYVLSTGVFTLQKKAKLNLSFTAATNGASSVQPAIYINGAAIHYSNSPAVINNGATVSLDGEFPAGTTFQFQVGNSTNAYRVSVLATASPDQILTVPETFSTDTAPLTYAGSGTYTLATLANAPVGTFITFTYAASSNTATQTTAAPTQTTADMNTNGFFLTGRGYTILSTAALPCRFDIQIGKGLKGQTIRGFTSTGKDNPIGFALRPLNVAFTALGGTETGYDPDTGILTINAGTDEGAISNTRRVGVRIDTGAGSNNGYFTVEASKNPALTGLGLGTVAARGVNTAGTNITTTTIPFDTVKTYDTHNALNTTTGTFTAPETGYYEAAWSVTFASIAYAQGDNWRSYITKNGSAYAYGSWNRCEAFQTIAHSNSSVGASGIYLAKGDTVTLVGVNTNSGGVALLTTSGTNYLSIHKTSVGTGN